MRRILLALLTTALLTGCAGQLGRTTPECDAPITTSSILQIQAVPDADFVPCVASLPIGWEYNHLQAQSGLSVFTLDSDRLGNEFLRVRTSETCRLGGTREQESPLDGMVLFTKVEADLVVPIVFVPEGPTDETIDAAQVIVTGLVGQTINDKQLDIVIDRTEGPDSDRIAAARADDAFVFVIGLREAEEGTVTLLVPGSDTEIRATVDEALDRIAEAVAPPSYRGSWIHVFDGGCIEYRFDATGPETHTLEDDVRDSLGFTDAEAVRELGRSYGYDI